MLSRIEDSLSFLSVPPRERVNFRAFSSPEAGSVAFWVSITLKRSKHKPGYMVYTSHPE